MARRIDQKRQPHSIIYALTLAGEDPIPGNVRYIGRSVQLPSERLRKHILAAQFHRGNSYHCRAWISKTIADGGSIAIHTLLRVDHEHSGHFERLLILCFRNLGARLTNLTDGGDGQIGRQVSEESRRKMSESRKGRKVSESHRRFLAAHLKRIASLDHVKQARAKAIREVTSRPEVRRKISESNRGKIITAEQRARISRTLTGKTQSEKTKAKRVSTLREKYWNDPQWRINYREKCRQRQPSAESLELMRQGALRRWAKVRANG